MPKKKLVRSRREKNRLYLYRANKAGIFYIRGTVDKKRLNESTGVYDEEYARHILSQREAEILDEKVHGRKSVITFEEAARDYLVNSPSRGGSNRRHIERLLVPVMGNTKLKEINSRRVHELIKVHYPGRSGSTTNTQFINPIVTVMRFAAEAGDCHVPRIRKFPNDSKILKAPPQEWIIEFIERCSRPRVRAFVAYTTTTGMRAITAIRTRWDQIDWDFERVVYDGDQMKNGLPFTAELTTSVAEMLGMLRDLESSSPFGPFSNYSRTDIANREIAKECKRLGMEVYTSHIIGRHAFAERLINSGYTLQEVADMGGWSDLDVLRKNYGHLEQSRLRKAVRDEAAKLFRSGLKVV